MEEVVLCLTVGPNPRVSCLNARGYLISLLVCYHTYLKPLKTKTLATLVWSVLYYISDVFF